MKENQDNNPQAKNTNLPLALNRRQLEVFELLRRFSKGKDRFHEWYLGALEVLNSSSSDRIAQAAHSIRELCDQLPERIANIPAFQSPVSGLKSAGQKFLRIKAQSYGSGWTGDINASLGELLLDFERIVQEPPRTKRLGRALVSTDPQTDVLSEKMRKERDEVFDELLWFLQIVAHHKHTIDESGFRGKLDLFESLLINYLTPSTAEQQRELKMLIQGAPSAEAVSRLKALISHKGANYLFFFENLDNPQWLPVLNQHGYFADLPGPEVMPDGQLAYRMHVPLISLINLAESAPREVTNVLVGLKLPNNYRVGDQVLRCMARIRDVSCVHDLRLLVIQLCDFPSRTSWLWIQELLKTWMELGVIADVFTVLERFLMATVDASSEQAHNRSEYWLAKQIDERILESLTAGYPLEVARISFKALIRWMQSDRQDRYESFYWERSSTSWLEDFKSPTRHLRELEGALATRIFKAANVVYQKADISGISEIDELLRSNQSDLFARLRWQLYADFPEHSLERARREVVSLMAQLKKANCGHNFEFAQLLRTHAQKHGASFLSADEVKLFAQHVFDGPLDVNGSLIKDFETRFRLKQLWPISHLLQGEEHESYRALLSNGIEPEIDAYKPFHSGGDARFIQQVPPKEADSLGAMALTQLWNFLNHWKPEKDRTSQGWWVEEDIGALAVKFAELVENQPERFVPADEWWKTLHRPALFSKYLERATQRIQKKGEEDKSATPVSQLDWSNWFGVAAWVVSQRPIFGEKSGDDSDWTWARIVVAKFVDTALSSNHQMPEVFLPRVKGLLLELVQEEDPRLSSQGGPGMRDWLTVAINSVRGDAIEALLQSALNQKSAGVSIEPWVFELIQSRLELPTESPAVFALLGAKLRFVIHLFEDELKEKPWLLFPVDRPIHREALIVAHISYDHPWNKIIQMFPDLLDVALKILEAKRTETADEDERSSRRDFASRLGSHIACYYWNGIFKDDVGEKLLDRFFASASKTTRAIVIGEIAQIGSKMRAEKADAEVISRVMYIWDRRFLKISKELSRRNSSISDYQEELAAFTHWLECECFPFGWRIERTMQVLDRLDKTPEVYHLFEAIYQFGVQTERLESILQLLRLMFSKPSDQLRWAIESDKLMPVIALGLASQELAVKKLAEECRDMLLKMNFSEFLNIENRDGETPA